MLNPIAFFHQALEKMEECACGWFTGAGTGKCDCGLFHGAGLPPPKE
ncbi:MAG: hypothetical protein IBX60_01260 [Candidatus Aminicenantes bacterium]|nr:hypothetical protein [Candidatus Aminicenantes bacterium]